MGGLPLPNVEKERRDDEVREVVAFVCFYVSPTIVRCLERGEG
jgi:hypothetical protein